MHVRADASTETAPETAWPDEIFAILQRFDVRQVPYVPDAGHSALEPGIRRALVAAVERFRALR